MKKLIMKVKVFGSLSALLLIAAAVLATSVENESDNPAIVSDELIQTSNIFLSPVQLTKDENNKKDNHYKSVFNDYCNYIEGHEWCNFLEKDIRQEMKLGDYKNVNQIENILNKKERYIEKLRHQMKSYEKL